MRFLIINSTVKSYKDFELKMNVLQIFAKISNSLHACFHASFSFVYTCIKPSLEMITHVKASKDCGRK